MGMNILRTTHVILFITILALAVGKTQTAQESFGFYHESYAREIAITRVMPIYPPDAVQRGITGLVQVKIAIDNQGKVAKIKIHPRVDSSLKQAVANAVDNWTFRLEPELTFAGRDTLSHLTFRFSINSGEPLVELYDPGLSAKDSEHLGYLNTSKELKEWKTWDEVQPTKINIKLKH